MDNIFLVNRYKIIHKIDEGGMGTVWKVYDDLEKKEVALKEIKTNDNDKAQMKSLSGSILGRRLSDNESRVTVTSTGISTTEAELRFSEEFRTMTKLQYPYTVKVFDYGVLENGNKYITMELIEGNNLKDLIATRKLEFQEIYKILIQLAQTLNFIHSRLYVHRDIKSENIILTKEGSIKIIDFGLMDRIGHVSDGKVTGTVHYLPPEVLKGGVINESSDLYSLGILAYEMVAGKLPFYSDEIMGIIKMHMNESPASLKDLRPDVPEEFEIIISKLLQKDQEDRYKNTPELIGELSKLSTEKVVTETLEQKKSYLLCSKLIGRDEESKRLKDFFADAKEGKGKAIFLSAHAGVGKSRLLQEFKVGVQLSETHFLEGFCVEQGMSAYQPFKEMLKPLLSMTKKETLNKYGSVLVKIIPELSKKGFKAAEVQDEFSEKVRINQTVVDWLKEISEKTPFVVCIEDLHWSDLASIDLLNVCIRDLREFPVMFLGTFRDDEVEESGPIFATVEEGLTELLKLSLLDQGNSLLLIEAMIGKMDFGDEFIEHVFSVTGGNPFFITETMKSLIEEEKIRLDQGIWKLPVDISELNIPLSIKDTVSRRLQLLSKEALKVARISSVLGREFDLSLLHVLSNLKEDEYFGILDELIERQFIMREDNRYIFIHDRIRETLYDQLDEKNRKELHEMAGSLIEEKNSANIKAVVHLLAYHLSRGMNRQKAVKYLLMAGDMSINQASYIGFIDNYVRALSFLEKIDYPNKEKVLFESRKKLIIYSYNIRAEVAIDSYLKMLPLVYNLGGGEKNVRKVAKIFQFVFKVIGTFPPGLAQKIKDKLTKEYPPYKMPKKNDFAHIITTLVEITMYYSVALFCQYELFKQLSVVEDVIENLLPETTGSIDYASVLIARASGYLGMGKYALIPKDMEEAIAIFEKNLSKLNDKQKYVLSTAWFWLNSAKSNMGTFREEEYQKQLKICEENNFYDTIAYAHLSKLADFQHKGMYNEAKIIETVILDLCKKLGYPKPLYVWCTVYMARLYLNRGDFLIAERLLDKARKFSLSDKGVDSGYNLLFSGLLHIYKGDLEKGVAIMEESVDFMGKYKIDGLSEALAELADVYLEMGEIEKAAALLDELKEMDTKEGFWNPLNQTRMYRVLGNHHLKNKNFEEAKSNIELSISKAQEVGNPIQEGLGLKSLGEVFVALTQRTYAKECFEKAISKFKEIDNEYQINRVQKMIDEMEK